MKTEKDLPRLTPITFKATIINNISMEIVSITAEIGLDVGHNYAGGLGVLEGDKFYASARLGVNYTVLTLFYHKGYVRYDDNLNPLEEDQSDLRLRKIGEAVLQTKRGDVRVEYLEYRINTSRVIFIKSVSPDWAIKATERLYLENSEDDRFYKYLILAKASENFITNFIGWDNVKYVDLQESYPALIVLLRYFPRYRVIIHTPAPWGHPSFPLKYFREELGFELPFDPVVMTEIALSSSVEGIVVSKKMLHHVRRTFPHHFYKIRAVTNAVEIPRWQHSLLREVKGFEDFVRKKREIKTESLMKLGRGEGTNRVVIGWARRVTQYKRPDFILRLIDEVKDSVFFIIGGKPHPREYFGLEVLKRFKEVSRKYSNVLFVNNVGINEERLIIWASDIWAFTPFSGWEASGTSFMKAGVNGVPTVASRDGAVPEIIKDGYNGWLYGEDRTELLPPDSYDHEYEEFKRKVNEALNHYEEVGYNAYLTFPKFCSMERYFKQMGFI
jgi:starch phosphorylase